MLIRFFTISIISFCFLMKGFSQKNSFFGSIMYENKFVKNCDIIINIDSSYQITGSTSREINGEMMNHMISGEFNPENVTIYLREYALNKSDCPIFFQGKVFDLAENIYSIAGVFKGLDTANCSSGHINVICRNFKFNLYPKPDKKPIALTEKEEETILTNLLNQKLKKEANFIQVRENDKIEIQAGADTLFLKIYDNQKVDGDRVSIEFNGDVVSENHLLTDEKVIYKLVPQKGKNTLKIIALNEGRIALNTSKVEIYNRHIHEYFINVLNKNQNTLYDIKN